jgi:hypothetical protein
MKRERILKKSLNVIRKYLKENGPMMSTSNIPTNRVGEKPGNIAGLLENPPVNIKKKKEPFKDLFRRSQSVQPKYPPR